MAVIMLGHRPPATGHRPPRSPLLNGGCHVHCVSRALSFAEITVRTGLATRSKMAIRLSRLSTHLHAWSREPIAKGDHQPVLATTPVGRGWHAEIVVVRTNERGEHLAAATEDDLPQ
jgi:hypothetical protein